LHSGCFFLAPPLLILVVAVLILLTIRIALRFSVWQLQVTMNMGATAQ
jgi:hypothetical protein